MAGGRKGRAGGEEGALRFRGWSRRDRAVFGRGASCWSCGRSSLHFFLCVLFSFSSFCVLSFLFISLSRPYTNSTAVCVKCVCCLPPRVAACLARASNIYQVFFFYGAEGSGGCKGRKGAVDFLFCFCFSVDRRARDSPPDRRTDGRIDEPTERRTALPTQRRTDRRADLPTERLTDGRTGLGKIV